jgi:hypothetical protein
MTERHHREHRIAPWRRRERPAATGRAAIGIAVAVAAMQISGAQAAENGAGFYLLGGKATGAGIVPPPGLFVENDLVIYDARLGGSKQIPLNGNIVANVDAQLRANFLEFLVVAPWDVLGGNFGFIFGIPFGGPDVTARAALTGPGGNTISRTATDSLFTIGDLAFGATLGWHAGKFHWNVGTLVNTPTGDYRPGALANLAFHRWAYDVSGAVTWLDPESGWDLSAAAGVTFNGKNPTTNYKTGTEFHVEWAATKYLSKEFSAGLVGYHYQQLTGDSGSGAVLGDFKGRVTALGATLGYTFQLGERPLATRFKIFREFNAKNRPEGTSVFFTASMPLTMFGHGSH